MKKAALILALLALVAPLALKAQLQMLLNRGKAQLIGVPTTPPPTQTTNTFKGYQANFFGDSVALGFNPNLPQPQPNLTNRFSTVLCTNLSMTEANYGVGGSEIADAQADMITTNVYSISNSTLNVWLTGYNDVFWFGTNAAALTDNQESVNSLAAWLGIPTSSRVPSSYNTLNGYTYSVSNSTIYFPAGWSALPASLGGLEYSTQTNAASFFFSGSTLLIGTARLSSGSGSVVVTVGDYVGGTLLPMYATNTYSCVRTSPNTGPGALGANWGNRSYSPGLIIITNLTANRHYAFFTPQSTAFTFLGWYASYATNQLPAVVLAGTLKIAGSNYTDVNLPAGYTNGSDLAANEYSAVFSNSAATLSGVGLNVKWVPIPVLNSNTDYFYDGIHPNASGHLKIESAIQLALTGTTGRGASLTLVSSENPSSFHDSVAFTATMPTDATGSLVFQVDGTPVTTNALSNGQAVYTTSALTLGLHTVVAAYSGDANYGATTTSLAQTVNAAVPPIVWTTPAPIAYGTALGALQLNATSSVAGIFTYAPIAGTVLNAGTNFLTAVFTPADGTNYARTTNTVSLTVQPAALTVTANNTNRHSNVANPVFTGSIVGLQNNDNITAIYTTTATISSPVGTYPIIPQLVDPAGRLTNYIVTMNYGTLTVSNGPPAAPSICYFFGDSVTLGFNPTPPQPQPTLTNRFSSLLCLNLSMIESNAGSGGSEIADGQADMITANNYTISNSTVSVWLTGYNDVFWFGTNQAALADNQEAVNSLAARLAIPTSMRVSETNVLVGALNPYTNSIYYPSGWGTLPNSLGGLAYSTQPNAALFFFSGSTLLIGTARLNSGAGTVVVTVGDYVDGNILPTYATNTYSCVRTSPNTGPGPTGAMFGYRSYSPGLIIITNLTANRHYAFFAPQSSADTFFGWYASYSTNQLPTVLLAGSLKIAGSNYLDANLPAGYFQGSDMAANEYSQMLSNSAATLSGLGLNVQWAPVPVLNSNTDYFSDGIHPNPNGHRKIAQALQAALTGTSYGSAGITLTSSENPSFFHDSVTFTVTAPADATGNLVFQVDGTPVATNALSNGQSGYATSALTLGLHIVVATYSGDANYNAATNSLAQTVNAALPPITWPTPAPIAYGTALSALQLNATSSVAGTFTYAPGLGTVLNAGTNFLTAAFAPTDGTDYSRTTNTVSLTVQPAALTVTANNTNRASNAANPVFTGSIVGLLNSDNITATFTTTATSNSPAGTYPITPQLVDPNGRLANYVVTTNYGTLTVTNGPSAVLNICYFFGDSVALGFNPTTPQPQPNLTNRFSSLLCSNVLLIESNAAVGGSEIADAQADAITANNYMISNSTISVWLAGYNDVFWFGTNQAALADNQEAVNSLAAWLAIPTSLRVSETNVLVGALNPYTNSIYYPPGWNTLPNALGGLAYSTQPNPALFYFSGSTLLIGTARLNNGAGTAVVTVGDYVNGNILPTYATNTYSCVRTSPNTGPGPSGATWGYRAYSPGLIIITNLTANRHYAFFTPQSGADTFLGWYAALSTNLSPEVILAGSLKIAGSNYLNANLPAGYLQGSDQAANAYSLMLSNSAATLSRVGLNVKWVPIPVLNSNTDYFNDGINPNASGHAKIEAAIQSGL